MAIKNLLLLVITLLLFSCSDNNDTSTTSTPNINEKIETIVINRFNVKDGNPDSLQSSGYIIEDFDENDNQVKAVYYTNDSTIMMQFINEYDNGNKVRVNWVNAQDTMIQYVKNTYNELNQLVKSETFGTDDKFKSGFIHRWKDDGMVEEKGPIEEGKAFRPNAIYTYRAKNEYIDLKEYDAKDSLYAVVEWQYTKEDASKNWTERRMITNKKLNRIEKRTIKYRE